MAIVIVAGVWSPSPRQPPAAGGATALAWPRAWLFHPYQHPPLATSRRYSHGKRACRVVAAATRAALATSPLEPRSGPVDRAHGDPPLVRAAGRVVRPRLRSSALGRGTGGTLAALLLFPPPQRCWPPSARRPSARSAWPVAGVLLVCGDSARCGPAGHPTWGSDRKRCWRWHDLPAGDCPRRVADRWSPPRRPPHRRLAWRPGPGLSRPWPSGHGVRSLGGQAAILSCSSVRPRPSGPAQPGGRVPEDGPLVVAVVIARGRFGHADRSAPQPHEGRGRGPLFVQDDVHHGVDQRQVGEGLREVAEVARCGGSISSA